MHPGGRTALRCLTVLLFAITLVCLLGGSATAQRRSCVDCHEGFKDHIDKKFVHVPVKDGCETCHKRHGFRQILILNKALPDLCTDCHEGVKEQMETGTVHGALSEGGCTVCHEPHASDSEALIRPTVEGKNVCMACHQDLAAVAESGNAHDPFAKGDCSACHQPHSSTFPALLNGSEDNVCEKCHPGAADKHDVMGLDDFGCSDCHDPHTASKKMKLAANSHPPFAEGDCESCHSVEDGEVEFGDDFPASDLCADCHDDIASTIAGGESHFGADPLSTGGTETCLKCHDPHKSGNPKLLVKNENGLCRGCHDALPEYGKHKGSLHKPFLDGECTDCHLPHGGGGAAHLVAEGNDVCAKCHESKLLPPPDGGIQHEALSDVDCVECHSGHAGEAAALLRGPASELCETCHDKTVHKVSHPPYQLASCFDCHQNHSNRPALLPASVKQTCGRCHKQQALAASLDHPHEPAQDEDCLFCHQPHGGEFKGLLQSPQRELCTDCHDLDDVVQHSDNPGDDTVSLHKPVERGECSGCHDPHGAKLPSLLTREGDMLCYGCHTEERVSFAAGVVHKPVADGQCDKCHTPHGSAFGDLRLMAEPALCTQCHDPVKQNLAESHKGVDVSDVKCTSCHAPHSSPGDYLLNPVVHEPFADDDCESCHEGPVPAGRPNAMASASATACLDCHDKEGPGHQHELDMDCLKCHQPHASRYGYLLSNRPRLCRGCHEDILQAGDGTQKVILHQPIVGGDCLECHQMHEPGGDKFLAKGQLELCSDCHESIQKRATHATQHRPFQKGQCSRCHETHASTYKHLLVDNQDKLCRKCHKLDGAKMIAAHKKIPLVGEACTSCHDPHSTKRANSSLVYDNLHPPYEDGDCDVCHSDDGTPARLASVCADCHDSDNDFATAHNGGRSAEKSGSIDVCLDCHSPHAGYTSLLVRDNQRDTCLQCHAREEFTRPVVHAALDEGCASCHDVHMNNTAVLKGTGVDAVCYTCHDDQKDHAHPVGQEYKDPRTGEPMTCVSCHSPHSSDYDHLTWFDHKRDLCVQCHASGTMRAH